MSRWWEIVGASQSDVYDDRWRRMEARGQWVHGEADLVSWFEPGLVLDAGCGTGRVAMELDRRGLDVVGVDIDTCMLGRGPQQGPAPPVGPGRLGGRGDRWPGAGGVGEARVRPNRDGGQRDRVRGGRHRGGDRGQHGPAPEPRAAGSWTGFRLGLSPLTFARYDRYAADAGLELEHRWTTWDREPFDGGSYAVTVQPPSSRRVTDDGGDHALAARLAHDCDHALAARLAHDCDHALAARLGPRLRSRPGGSAGPRLRSAAARPAERPVGTAGVGIGGGGRPSGPRVPDAGAEPPPPRRPGAVGGGPRRPAKARRREGPGSSTRSTAPTTSA